MNFEPLELEKVYKNCEIIKNAGTTEKVVFRNNQGDYFSLFFSKIDGKYSYMFYHDNYPFPKRYFAHDMPIDSMEQFEEDLKRMKIPVPERL